MCFNSNVYLKTCLVKKKTFMFFVIFFTQDFFRRLLAPNCRQSFVNILNIFSPSLLHKMLAVFFSSSQAIYYSHRLELLVLFQSYNSVAPSRFFYFPSRAFFMTHEFFGWKFPRAIRLVQPNKVRRIFGSHKNVYKPPTANISGKKTKKTLWISVGYNPLILYAHRL